MVLNVTRCLLFLCFVMVLFKQIVVEREQEDCDDRGNVNHVQIVQEGGYQWACCCDEQEGY